MRYPISYCPTPGMRLCMCSLGVPAGFAWCSYHERLGRRLCGSCQRRGNHILSIFLRGGGGWWQGRDSGLFFCILHSFECYCYCYDIIIIIIVWLCFCDSLALVSLIDCCCLLFAFAELNSSSVFFLKGEWNGEISFCSESGVMPSCTAQAVAWISSRFSAWGKVICGVQVELSCFAIVCWLVLYTFVWWHLNWLWFVSFSLLGEYKFLSQSGSTWNCIRSPFNAVCSSVFPFSKNTQYAAFLCGIIVLHLLSLTFLRRCMQCRSRPDQKGKDRAGAIAIVSMLIERFGTHLRKPAQITRFGIRYLTPPPAHYRNARFQLEKVVLAGGDDAQRVLAQL